MTLHLVEIAMKSATFMGVVVSAVVLMGGHRVKRPLLVGAAGVVLMVLNARLNAWGVLLDAAYLGLAARVAWRALARRETTFTLVAARAA